MSIPALPLASSVGGDHYPQNRANGPGSQGRGKTLKRPLSLMFQVTWSDHPMSLTVGSDVHGGGGNILGAMEMGMLVRLARFF